jgi:Ca2+-binding RTX toxin-like protein
MHSSVLELVVLATSTVGVSVSSANVGAAAGVVLLTYTNASYSSTTNTTVTTVTEADSLRTLTLLSLTLCTMVCRNNLDEPAELDEVEAGAGGDAPTGGAGNIELCSFFEEYDKNGRYCAVIQAIELSLTSITMC